MQLTSSQNPKIKYVCKLRNRRERERAGLTILEGYRELTRSFEYGMAITECYYCPEMFLGENEISLLDKLEASGVKIFHVTAHILKKMAYRDRPEGLIAVAKTKNHILNEIPTHNNNLLLLAEAIEKPGNLGSILRSADAGGADGLIICNKQTDIYNPNVIRASTGALFCVPIAEASPEEALAWLKERNIKIVAATPHAKTIFTDVDMTLGTAIAIGSEQYGLSDFWLDNADVQIQIPMLGKIDSLNVATATTILLYEAARQRSWKKCDEEEQL